MVEDIFPVVKVRDPSTYQVFQKTYCPTIVVPLQDFLTKTSFKFNSKFYEIVKDGGLHKSLGYRGKIIFSLIMRDEIIRHFVPETKKYASAIRALKPDYFTTVDTWTYEKMRGSARVIECCLNQTKELLSLCPEYKAVGLVKGNSPQQIRYYCKSLKEMGILDMMFHTGDFFRHGSHHMAKKALSYAQIVRQEASTLFLYGLGASSRFREFSFADYYITFTHFVAATQGKVIIQGRQQFCGGPYTSLILPNFLEIRKEMRKEMRKYMLQLKYQKKLTTERGECPWEEEQEAVEHPTAPQGATVMEI